MANLAELKKYLNYEFSSGCYTGEDYKSFQTKYINYLKQVCVYIYQRRQVFQQRMVQQYTHSHSEKRSRLQRRF